MADIVTSNAKGDALHEALRAIVSVPKRVCLWTESDGFTFTPELADTVFGDGLCLFTITTIHNRPRYWIIRGDSSWETGMDMDAPDNAPEFIEFTDEICFAMQDEFGDGRPDEDGAYDAAGRYRDRDTGRFLRGQQLYPAFDDRDGTMWARMDWPAIDGFTFQPHPWARTNVPAIDI